MGYIFLIVKVLPEKITQFLLKTNKLFPHDIIWQHATCGSNNTLVLSYVSTKRIKMKKKEDTHDQIVTIWPAMSL
jgi:hypothetical protein